MANTLKLSCKGAVGFIDWLDDHGDNGMTAPLWSMRKSAL
jgi:hypothetical protein